MHFEGMCHLLLKQVGGSRTESQQGAECFGIHHKRAALMIAAVTARMAIAATMTIASTSVPRAGGSQQVSQETPRTTNGHAPSTPP